MQNIKLTFTGDAFINKNTINSYKKGDYDFNNTFCEMKDFFKESDYVISNLETPLSNDINELSHRDYTFTSPKQYAEALKKCGVDCVTTANNHCLDNGESGIKKTIDILDDIGLKHTGTSYDSEDELILDINGIKIALLSYTYGTNAFNNNVYIKDKKIKVNMFQKQELSNPIIRNIYFAKNFLFKVIRKICKLLNLFQMNKLAFDRIESSYKQKREIKQKVKEYKDKSDYIIMCMHEGSQNNANVSKKAYKTVKFLKNIGVDLIVGNHEHVVQKSEFLGDTFVEYCLGNFSSPSGVIDPPFDVLCDYSILLNVYLTKKESTLSVDKITFTTLKQNKILVNGKEYIQTRLLYDLINEENDEKIKSQLIANNDLLINRVLCHNATHEVLKEYLILK